MNEAAINFNPFATGDDGTCFVLSGGCVIPFACNYDPYADFYDGSDLRLLVPHALEQRRMRQNARRD